MSDKLQRYQPPGGMTRIDRLKEALRSYWMGPISSSDPGAREFFGGSSTSTGVAVNESTALNYSAVYAAVQLISSQVGNLPLVLYKKLGNGGKERFDAHPLYRLIHDRPNPDMSSLVWREASQGHVLTWGNLYTEIQRNGAGRPVALWPITPDRVTPFRRSSDAPLQYRVVNGDGGDVFIPASDMIHVPGLGFDGICGYSVITKMRESIGLGLAAERFGGTFFGNGSTFGGVISYKGPRPAEISDKNYRDQLSSQHQGVDKAHKFLALYNDASYTRLGIPPNDAQFLETRQFQVDEVARWFNLPPHKLKELMRSTNNNIEHQNLEYYIDCLSPWLERWEQELCEKLISPLERNQQEIEFVADGLLRGDVASRGDFHSKQFATGALAPNDIRRIENRNPLDGGEDAFVPLNLIPLPLARPYWDASIEAMKAKAEADRRPPPTPVAAPAPSAGRDDAAIALLTEARDTARRCAQEAEDAKDIIASELVKTQVELAHARSQWDAERTALVGDLSTRDAALEQVRGEALHASKRVTDGEAQHAEAQRTIERLTAQATALGTDLGTATRDLAAAIERAELVEADYQRVCGDKTNLERDVTSAGVTITALEAERAELKSQTEGLSLNVATSQRETADALKQITGLEAAIQQNATDRVREVSTYQTTVTDLRATVETLTQQHDTASAALVEATAKIADVEGAHRRDIGAWEADVQRLTEARANGDAVHTATIAELRAQVSTVTQELATSTAALLDAKTAIGALEATRETDRAAITTAEADITRHASVVEQVQTRLAESQRAVLGVVTVVLRDLITRESDRARKAQGTTEKLGKWIESFYPMHEDFCRAALRPSIRALLVTSGTDLDADRLLDRIIPSFIGDSTRQLRAVVMDADQETLGPALERIFRRWETERADAVAARILKEAS